MIEAMLDAVPDDARPVTDSCVNEINARREQFWQAVAPDLHSAEAPLRPERVIEALNRVIPSPCFVVSDAGPPTPYATRFLRLRDPDFKLIIPRFYGGLGYAMPAVVGAWFAAPISSRSGCSTTAPWACRPENSRRWRGCKCPRC